jgi:phosphatidylserine/phosphatidylglycerophosphate/cardiolipin synthase-like enzyme
VVGHHRRRLERLGQGVALAPAAGGWATARPRFAGNALEVLVDGAEALPQIARAIEAARSSVWLAGWFFTPEFRLDHDDPRTLRELLAEVAQRVDVRLLAWAGAPLPLLSSGSTRGRRGQARPGRRHRRSCRARLA